MRTRNQELECRIKDIFNKFYKEKMEEEKISSFTLNADEINGMLSIEVTEKDSGKFYSEKAEDEIFYKFVKYREAYMLLFMKLESFVKGCDLP